MDTLTRTEIRAMRRQLPAMDKADDRICSKLTDLICQMSPSAVLAFSSVKGEPDLQQVFAYCFANNIPLALPLCDTDSETMTFRIVNSMEDLCIGAYGIKEPSPTAPVLIPDSRALCIVPGLSFDEKGGRMGNGKGYYDKYLSCFPMYKTGVCYDAFLQSSIPQNPWDVAMDRVITDKREIQEKR